METRVIGSYNEPLTQSSFSAILEVSLALKSYKDSIVLVGGWVPYLLIDRFGKDDFVHIGSIDIDLAIDPDQIEPEEYSTIVELLQARGYEHRKSPDGTRISFSFEKDIKFTMNGMVHTIQVDLLTSRGSVKRHRHRKVQDDLPARIVDGCEIAFTHNAIFDITGTLPDDGKTSLKIKALDIIGCIGMKGLVLGQRYKEKDAYDLYSVIANCYGGPSEIARLVKPALKDRIITQGIQNIREKWRNISAEGPSWVAFFMEPVDLEERKRRQADAYVTVKKFLDGLA